MVQKEIHICNRSVNGFLTDILPYDFDIEESLMESIEILTVASSMHSPSDEISKAYNHATHSLQGAARKQAL